MNKLKNAFGQGSTGQSCADYIHPASSLSHTTSTANRNRILLMTFYITHSSVFLNYELKHGGE